MTAPESSYYFREAFPIWISVQNSEKWKSIDPLCELKKQVLESVHHRPKLRDYEPVSLILQKYIHLALEQKMSPRADLDKAARENTQRRLPF